MKLISLMKSSIFTLVALMLISSYAHAAPEIIVPTHANQGSAILLELPNLDNSHGKITVHWLDKFMELYIDSNGVHQHASIYLPMPYDATESQTLTIYFGNETVSRVIHPVGVTWRQSTLSVAPSYVAPPAEAQAQIERDRVTNANVIGTYTMANTLDDRALLHPTDTIITSEYGVQRVYNGSLQSVHRGVDFRGNENTPIHAIAAGRVVTAQPQYYLGNVVYIDHGQASYSIYGHMTRIAVQEGDWVEAGDVLGVCGATGRVTGPHLHLSLTLQGHSINALPLLPPSPDM